MCTLSIVAQHKWDASMILRRRLLVQCRCHSYLPFPSLSIPTANRNYTCFFFCVTSLRWLNFCRIFSCSIFHFILLLDGIFQFRKLLSTFQNSRCFFEFSECSNSTVVTRFKLSCIFTFRPNRLELSWNTLDLPRKQNSLSETKVHVQRQTKQLNMQNTFYTHLSIFAYPFDSTSFQLHFTCEDNKIAAIIRYTCFVMCTMFTPLEH